MTSILLFSFALYAAFGAYRIKYRGRVDLISGVKDPALLADAKGLATFVGNLTFAVAGVFAVCAILLAVLPLPHSLAVFVVSVLIHAGAVIATINATQSRLGPVGHPSSTP